MQQQTFNETELNQKFKSFLSKASNNNVKRSAVEFEERKNELASIINDEYIKGKVRTYPKNKEPTSKKSSAVKNERAKLYKTFE